MYDSPSRGLSRWAPSIGAFLEGLDLHNRTLVATLLCVCAVRVSNTHRSTIRHVSYYFPIIKINFIILASRLVEF